jgi:hypothetical protein
MTGMVPRRDPVHHWRHMRASSAGRGVSFHPGRQHGQQAPLTEVVRGLGSTVLARPTLLTTWAPRYGPSWPRVTSRHAHSLPGIRSLTSDSCSYIRNGWRQCGPPWGQRSYPRLNPYPQGRARRNPPRPRGVGWEGVCALGVGRDGALLKGLGEPVNTPWTIRAN